MSLDTEPTEKDIKTRIETLFPGTPRVWVSAVPDNVPTPQTPYCVLYFGSPVRTGSDHHITSTRNDTLRGFVTVQWISRDDESCRAMANKTRNLLTGYRPVDSGEMILEGGGSYSSANGGVKPTLFYRETGYSYRTNLSWVD